MDQNLTAPPTQYPQNPDLQEIEQKPLVPQRATSYPKYLRLKILIPFLFTLIVILSFVAYKYFFAKNVKITQITLKETPSSTKSQIPSISSVPWTTPTPTIVPTFSIAGMLKQLRRDLQLMPDVRFPVTYYEAGTFTSGKYSGYKRIVAVSQEETPGRTTCSDSIFLTNDDVNYIGNGESKSSYSNPFNKNKVTQIMTIDYSIPPTIQIDSNFSLSSNTWISFKNLNSNPPDCRLNSPPNKNMILLSTSADYNVYFVNSLNNPIIAPDTNVIIIDKAGLPFEYTLTEKESYKHLSGTGPGQYTTSTEDIFAYNDGGLRDSKLKNSDNFYTDSYRPGFNMRYPDYPRFVPDFSRLKTNDFIQVENINGSIPIYVLSDSVATSIYQTRYQKISGIAQTYVGKPTTDLVRDVPFHKPTFAEYVQKHPFIFIKDYFGRFVLFEEFTYQQWYDPRPI